MATAEPLAKDNTPVALPGLARALISAGKLEGRAAEDIYRRSLDQYDEPRSFGAWGRFC